MPGGLAAVDVQDLARDKGGVLGVGDTVDHVADVADPAERVKCCHSRVRARLVLGCPDNAERDSVDAHAA